MSDSANRILTTHVGSLIRPPELLGQIEARQEGRPVNDTVFTDVLRRSVAEVVRQQADAGIDVASDGFEQRQLFRGRICKRCLAEPACAFFRSSFGVDRSNHSHKRKWPDSLPAHSASTIRGLLPIRFRYRFLQASQAWSPSFP